MSDQPQDAFTWPRNERGRVAISRARGLPGHAALITHNGQDLIIIAPSPTTVTRFCHHLELGKPQTVPVNLKPA